MCLIALAIDQDRRFPLVIATNRDEFHARPAARLGWWTPDGGGPAILGGRDMSAGGTWLGMTTQGRLGLLTNVREPKARSDPRAPSRGRIVPEWLAGREPPDRFWMRTALSGHNGFNLVAADFRLGECFWASNRAPYPRRLERGLYGLSNALLDTPWPKVQALKSALAAAIRSAPSVDGLSLLLFAALASRERPPDEALPSTGVPLDAERMLAPAFIRSDDGAYGTRCSTLVIAERVQRSIVTHVLERSFSPNGAALLRRATLKNWPPRYQLDPEVDDDSPTLQEPVRDSELDQSAALQPRKRLRVRSLLKPARPRG
ncbi:NRDE family protein [Piscinibacter sakaiensis]|uniref:COG3332 family protein n=1 Tax=Piscinibacter sakaiensis TaxID=1547922 RepID=A0A0K8NWF5_PISS1|nr:NRDE family protein [Piscinibacter sakaiensis]GAP34703.1 COG3332 family protein [Piscinibacter sakaiensis]